MPVPTKADMARNGVGFARVSEQVWASNSATADGRVRKLNGERCNRKRLKGYLGGLAGVESKARGLRVGGAGSVGWRTGAGLGWSLVMPVSVSDLWTVGGIIVD